ncbi:hypothetical protein [Chlamydia vaughanii]|uniref:hypothetical protein n=1 Tax=Chlamydia vaughanii TaxID=3112552 RepID=UPI0032B2B97F
MAAPDPKTKISFPTFVRFNIISQNLSEEKKKKALVVTKKITAQNTDINKLTATSGGLSCKQDLFVGNKISTTMEKKGETVDFYGRVNLVNHTVKYQDKSYFTGHLQQYLPYTTYQKTGLKYSMRYSVSGGHVGSGDITGDVRWDAFGKEQEKIDDSCVRIDSTNSVKLNFSASRDEPKLFRITVVLSKHGGWFDNGWGGKMMLMAVVNDRQTLLQCGTCEGTKWQRPKPMQFPPATFLARDNGYFLIQKLDKSFRAQFFSWNVVQLPFYEH